MSHRIGAAILVLIANVAWADEESEQNPTGRSAAEPANEPAGVDWARDTLSGDWGGLRTRLDGKGVQLGLNYIGEVLGNPVGGLRHGAIYEGRLELTTTIDLGKAFGWSGATFHANAYQIHGRGLSANNLSNNILVASGIEATRATRLFDLWLQQELADGAVSLRLGQLAADDEFATSQYAADFVNSTFGWPAILAANLPNGGPVYPLATPGIRLRVAPSDRLSLAVALFNGDPAGPGPSPQSRNASGTDFRTEDGAFVIAEAAYALNQGKEASGLPGTYKLGAWYHSGSFADQRFDQAGVSLASPASSGDPARRRSNGGLYLGIDQTVWRVGDDGDRGLALFLRLAGNPDDRNLVAFYADGGVSYKGLLPGRGADVLGLAVAYAGISDRARALDRDFVAAGAPRPVRDYEAAIELTYKAQLAPALTAQPDLQYIVHPGSNIARPDDPTGRRAIPDALVAGVRFAVTF